MSAPNLALTVHRIYWGTFTGPSDAGFTVETANRQGSGVIQSTIVNEFLEADLVIADLTEHNPNVLFELRRRMAAL